MRRVDVLTGKHICFCGLADKRLALRVVCRRAATYGEHESIRNGSIPISRWGRFWGPVFEARSLEDIQISIFGIFCLLK